MEVKKAEFHKKTWGNERWCCNNRQYCGKILTIEKGKYCSMHMHVKKTEDFYVLKGMIKLEYQLSAPKEVLKADLIRIGQVEQVTLKEGDSIHIQPWLLHRFTGLAEENQIIETSTQHFEDDSYRVEPTYKG